MGGKECEVSFVSRRLGGKAFSDLRPDHDSIEYAITQYLEHALPPDALAFHIPNSGFRMAPQQCIRAGWLQGIPDRCVLWNGKAHFLECKGPRGRLSPTQEEMFVRIEDAGCEAAVVRSVDDVEAALTEWGVPLTARLKQQG